MQIALKIDYYDGENGIGAEKKTNRSTPCPKKYSSSLFFGLHNHWTCRNVAPVSNPSAQEGARARFRSGIDGLLFILFLSLSDLRETHPKFSLINC